ncbi:MAG TPA: CopG family transcriptional regulator [Planctomycetota bacterium]|jgi:predicted transcriptional regulator
MSRTVTLRLDASVYERLRLCAQRDNRPLSNFIETAALRYLDETEYVDEYEMAEIGANTALNRSLKRGVADARAKRGRFV